ncbi:hypothetical protein BJX66DRAFT_49469 [Aspergillus keveii]|uniref:Uncharacterized protein n=1 Tax=Aspergillus keveii TaxID=714993 RepID=A0ABR4FRI2_9EURO
MAGVGASRESSLRFAILTCRCLRGVSAARMFRSTFSMRYGLTVLHIRTIAAAAHTTRRASIWSACRKLDACASLGFPSFLRGKQGQKSPLVLASSNARVYLAAMKGLPRGPTKSRNWRVQYVGENGRWPDQEPQQARTETETMPSFRPRAKYGSVCCTLPRNRQDIRKFSSIALVKKEE